MRKYNRTVDNLSKKSVDLTEGTLMMVRSVNGESQYYPPRMVF